MKTATLAGSILALLALLLSLQGGAYADAGQSNLQITTVDSGGGQIVGYYTVLSQNGAVLGTGFSPADFAVNNGEEYVVSVGDYGDYAFDHWQDAGSAPRERPVSITSDAELVAVYRSLSGNSPPPEIEDPEEPPSGPAVIEVRTVDSADSEISGYYTILSQEGAAVATGFSPVEFTVNNGQQYTISVSDYGSYFFSRWEGTGSADREMEITADGDDVFTAIYGTTDGDEEEPPLPPPPPPDDPEPAGQSALEVGTALGNGDAIAGYYVVLSKDGAGVATGFSPATFTLDNGADYTVSVSDYGDYAFERWSDSGSDERQRSISITADTEITAIYRNINGGNDDDDAKTPEEPEPPSPPLPPSSSGSFTLSIETTGQSGNEIFGYYVALLQGGALVQSGFSPAEFTLDGGQAYEVTVSDYGDYAFDYWSDTDSGDRQRSISIGADTQLTAVYENIGSSDSNDDDDTPPPPPPPQPSSNATWITFHAHRMPSPHWGPTFASASASMFFGLYDAGGNPVATGFADENGSTFTGLQAGESYYVYPSDCYGCHGSDHDVLFRHWGDGSTERLKLAGTGSSVDAYFEYVS